MKYCYLFFTAITVSIDSVLFGTKLSKTDKNNLFFIAVSTLIIFFSCFLCCCFGRLLGKYLSEKSHIISGIILILIAVYDYFYSSDSSKSSVGLKGTLLLSLALGADGVSAGFSLTLAGYNPITVSVTFTLFHLLFACLSGIFVKSKKIKQVLENKYLCPIFMSALGIYKIISSLL